MRNGTHPDSEQHSHCSQCSLDILQALQSANTLAKQYAESSQEAYNSGLKQKARIHSQRKDALYDLKQAVLRRFVTEGCFDTIRTHKINGREYYCVYVGEFSFHTPAKEWDSPPEDAPESATRLSDFDSDPDNRPMEMDEQEALRLLANEFESPNYHIKAPFTRDNYGSRFVGWSYLPGSLEEGDKVPDQHLLEQNKKKEFLFNIGDMFQTKKGACEVTGRYYAYLTPRLDRSPLLQRKAYDVIIDGDHRDCVRERQIIDGWNVIAHSIADPIPHVDGELAEIAGSTAEDIPEDAPEFDIGDILELQPLNSGEESVYCRLTEVHVSGPLLIGQYEPVPPTDEAPLGLTIEEIADDVAAVHDSPPV
jgi:hypothetical protein